MMVVLEKNTKKKLMEIIPLYLEYVGEYLKNTPKLPDELNPINCLSVNIDELSYEEQEELILTIEYNIEMLKALLGELSFHY